MTIQTTMHGRIGKLETKIWEKTSENKQHTTTEKKPFTAMSLVVDRDRDKDKGPIWVEVSVWSPDLREKLSGCGSGDHVLLQGNLTLDKYVNHNKEKQIGLKVQAHNITVLSRKSPQQTPKESFESKAHSGGAEQKYF